MGEHALARQAYSQALLLAPHQPGLHANLGLSYAMTNELPQAESHLRQAVALPGASTRVRQNLALVVGLQGRFDEARTLYAAELPPDAVTANMDYIRVHADPAEPLRRSGRYASGSRSCVSTADPSTPNPLPRLPFLPRGRRWLAKPGRMRGQWSQPLTKVISERPTPLDCNAKLRHKSRDVHCNSHARQIVETTRDFNPMDDPSSRIWTVNGVAPYALRLSFPG